MATVYNRRLFVHVRGLAMKKVTESKYFEIFMEELLPDVFDTEIIFKKELYNKFNIDKWVTDQVANTLNRVKKYDKLSSPKKFVNVLKKELDDDFEFMVSIGLVKEWVNNKPFVVKILRKDWVDMP